MLITGTVGRSGGDHSCVNHYEKRLPMDHLSQHPVGNLRDICPMADAVWFYLVASYSLSRACSVYLPCWLLLASKSVCISHSASTSPTVFRNRSYAVCNSSLLLSLYANDLGGNRCGTDVYLPGVRHVVLGVILERNLFFYKRLVRRRYADR